MKQSEWHARVEQCIHEWEVYDTRFPIFPDDDSLVIEKIRCSKCEAFSERFSEQTVMDAIKQVNN